MTKLSLSLPSECILRRASAQDSRSIWKLVLGAKLDPTQLRWQQFWVIDCDGHLVACGQLRNFDGAQELGSLVVAPKWRDRGLGSFLVQHLITQATEPLYLECLGKGRAQFFSRFGFVPVSWQELPRSLKFKFGVSFLGRKVLRIPVEILGFREWGVGSRE
ncbi:MULTISPECIES: GNAT family N-acetyltransferase [unclassified Coleofasciculus]|uniref:GNAT family N-acetyltransferase n=1 Tax=unclassified Coleofasciculus TaxID=2692782 RepID=UPI001881BFA6|nr:MULTISPECIES: GNAT family N-acetyltransferase [unclassified Coleofasciculus]MBE9128519.1 GNAT family N-acetyltransferase [Coleofasciculus sp. LEGE 07081]MBE9151277.1 GNAT family N-acetyltransferase [Coleofasciculus sp. LEGE 07092]